MKIFESISVMLLLAATVVYYIQFMIAYVNGGKVLMDINSIGEATFELVLLNIILICGIITLIRVTKRIGE